MFPSGAGMAKPEVAIRPGRSEYQGGQRLAHILPWEVSGAPCSSSAMFVLALKLYNED